MPAHKVEGGVFGRLTVLGRETLALKKSMLLWVCKCACGSTTTATANQLINKGKLSCGCLRRETTKEKRTTHGASGTKSYWAWCALRKRCNDLKNINYGGRGIKYSSQWEEFHAFFADMGAAPPGMTLERLDVNGNYELGNCVWADQKTQCRNQRRTIKIERDGEVKSLPEWCELLNLNYGVIYSRISRGALPIDALQVGEK